VLLTAQVCIENIWLRIWYAESMWWTMPAILSGVRKFQYIIKARLTQVEPVKSKTYLPVSWQRQWRDVNVMQTTSSLNKIKWKVWMHYNSRHQSSQQMTVTGKLIYNVNSYDRNVSYFNLQS